MPYVGGGMLFRRFRRGATGVDKFKVFDRERVHCLRFIAMLTPINAYLRNVGGGPPSLAQASLWSMLILGEDEIAWTGSEDFEPCLNLFHLTEA